MRPGKLLVLLICSTTAFSQQNEKFSVTYNRNIESYFLAELLAVDYRKTNTSFEEYKRKECRKYQPLVAEVLQNYGHLKTHKIANLTAEFDDTLVSYGMGNDVMMAPLLYKKEFPANEYDQGYSFRNDHLSREKQLIIDSLIKNYIEELHAFYISANLQQLFKKFQKYYTGAIREVNNLIPAGFTTALESFYGETRLSYTALVSPMMMWPIEDNEGRGIGASVQSATGTRVFEIMSPYIKVEVSHKAGNYHAFGYNYKPRAMLLTIHEFGHSFVNKEVEKYSGRIEKSDSLFKNSALKTAMESKGVQSWEAYIIESIVRLGEIRIAEMQHDKQRAIGLRKYHIDTEHFIHLPLLEEKIKLYEAARTIYPKLGDFLPELLTVFEQSNVGFINSKLMVH